MKELKFFFTQLYEYVAESRHQQSPMSVSDFFKFYQLGRESRDYHNGTDTNQS